MADIFISYSTHDRVPAQKLVGRLRSEGFSVWIDESGISAAAQWSSEIVRAIESSTVFIILLSKSAFESHNVIKELSLASEEKKHIIPVEVEHIELSHEVKYQLAGIQRVPYNETSRIIEAVSRFIERNNPPPPSGSSVANRVSKRNIFAAVTALSLIAICFFFFFTKKKNAFGEGKKAVVVLPFTDQSPAKENEYLSLGFSDELMDVLGKSTDLSVVSKTVAMDYRGAKMSPQEVGSELGVRYVISGAMIKNEDGISLEMHILDNKAHTQLANLSYRGPTNDIFRLQKELAADAAASLGSSGIEEKGLAKESRTNNFEAYQALLQARIASEDKSHESILRAMDFYDRAVTIDSNYADAWAERGYFAAKWAAEINKLSSWAMIAEESSNKAVALDPKQPEGYVALGWTYWRKFAMSGDQDTQLIRQAIKSAQQAVNLEPNNAEYLINLADIQRYDTTLKKEANANVRKAMVLDPNNYNAFVTLVNVGDTTVRPYLQKAKDVFSHVLRLHPDDPFLKLRYANMLVGMRDTPYVENYIDTLTERYSSVIVVFYNACGQYLGLHRPMKALSAIEHMKAILAPDMWIYMKKRLGVMMNQFPEEIRKSERFRKIMS